MTEIEDAIATLREAVDEFDPFDPTGFKPRAIAALDLVKKEIARLEGEWRREKDWRKELWNRVETSDAEVARLTVKCAFPSCVDGGEKPKWCGRCGDAQRADAAEDEVARLTKDRDTRMMGQFRLQDERDLMRTQRDGYIAEVDRLTETAELATTSYQQAEQEIVRLRGGLRRIRQWDCLNPPQPDLLADLPWLAHELDTLLEDTP